MSYYSLTGIKNHRMWVLMRFCSQAYFETTIYYKNEKTKKPYACTGSGSLPYLVCQLSLKIVRLHVHQQTGCDTKTCCG